MIRIQAINQVALPVIRIQAINRQADQMHLKGQIVAINRGAQEDLTLVRVKVEAGNQKNLAVTLTPVKEQILVISHLLAIQIPVISQVEAKFYEYET